MGRKLTASRLVALSVTALLLLGPRAAVAAEIMASDSRECFDAAVVAQVLRAIPTPIPDAGPDEIVMRWPWHLDLEVEQVLIGSPPPDSLRVVSIQHTGFNPQIKHFLFFLRREDNGKYVVAGMEFRIVRDNLGRFAMPLSAPLEEDQLRPEGRIDSGYEKRLKALRYVPRDAWWLRPPHLDSTELDGFDPAWAHRSGPGLVAKRGLILDDLAEMIRAQPGAVCKHP